MTTSLGSRIPGGDLDDSINIVGISSFINGDRGADIREIERSLVEQDAPQSIKDPGNTDILGEWRKRIAAMESTVGISLRDEGDAGDGDDDDDTASIYGAGSQYGGAAAPSGISPNGINQQYGQYPGAAYTNAGQAYGQFGGPESRYDAMQTQFRDPMMISLSDEQRKQRILQSALSNINTHPMQNSEKFSFDIEKSNDKKKMLLEQINMLRTNLDDDGIKIADIQLVTSDNTFDEVESVYKQLRYRNDHARYCSFANEFAQMGALGLEWAFDGRKSYIGFKPDLTGWSSTLNIKMRRLSYETSSLVSDGMREYNVGNFTRVLLELVPSIFLHAKMRANKSGKSDTRPSNNDVSSALGNLRNMSDTSKDR
jgi:hypothetical protein